MKIVQGLHKSGEQSINYNGFKANFPILEVDSFPIFSDKDGKSWTDHLIEFESQTFKLLVDSSGMIRSFSYDVTSIGIPNTEIVDIIEIDPSTLPDNFFEPELFTNWAWNFDKGIYERELDCHEQLLFNTKKKKEMQTEILEEIAKYQILEKYEISTESDNERLTLLEKALIQLHNINTSDESIIWPEI